MAINILLIDAFPLWREGAKHAIAQKKEMHVAAETTEVQAIRSAVATASVNLVLLDLDIPGGDGFELLRLVKTLSADIPVLILSGLSEDTFGVRALREGAAGFLKKDCTPEELVTAIEKVHSGQKYISPSMTQKIASYLDSGIQKMPHERLTTREFQIMLMIGKGMTLKEVSERLSLSYTTITTHKNRILSKMGLRSCAQIVWYVAEEKLIK